jgi:uncharacterized membrane protein (UPF0127 family)
MSRHAFNYTGFFAMRLGATSRFHHIVILLQLALFALFLAPSASFAGQVLIDSHNVIHTFNVEEARTDEQQKAGLMYREELADDAGMIFIEHPPRTISMWMKNTPISLDMIFIDTDNAITKIEKNTKPESLDEISSEVPVIAVLELKGGICDAKGIKVGDKVAYVAKDFPEHH